MIDTLKLTAHIQHAVEKHPHFCDELCNADPRFTAYALSTARGVMAAHDESHCLTAGDVLHCEVCEAYDAYAHGRMDEAVEDCYDAMAVLARMIYRIQKEAEEQTEHDETEGWTK